MAASSEDDSAPAGVWVFMSIYIGFLIAVAAWSWYQDRQKAKQRQDRRMAGEVVPEPDPVAEHYVASRDLGPWALALTLLASTWSGYTVVGAPQDTYRRGWNATRYMGGFVITQSTMLLVVARMQWYAFKRNYTSTVDFITDRYRSHFTRIFVSVAQLLSTVLYVMGQFKSIGATVEGMSDDAVPAIWASSVMCIIMLCYEWFGGMRAIALTDLVQGVILIGGCLLYFIAMEVVFPGGIVQTTKDLRECAVLWDANDDGYPCTTAEGGICTDLDTDEAIAWFQGQGCVLDGEPDGSGPKYGAKDAGDLLTIDDDDVAAWLPFYVAGISFPIYPQILVRFYAARNVKHLQYAMQLTHLSVFYLCLPAFLTGYTILSRNLPGLNPGVDRDGGGTTDKAFAKIMNATIEHNWFFYITGSTTVVAAIAAYMSTADSALMAASSMVTLDFSRDYILERYMGSPTNQMEKERQQRILLMIAKVTSIVFGIFAVLMTLIDIALTDLYVIQGTILMLGCPAYFFGMYNKTVNAFAVNVGIVVGVIVFIILYAMEKDIPEFWSTVANVGATLIVAYVPQLTQLWYGKRNVWDPALTPKFLDRKDALDRRVVGYDISAYGLKFEPIRPWWINFIVFLLLFLAIPFWQNIPSSYDDNAFSGAMPTWAVVSTFFAAIAMIINMFQTYYNWSDWISEEGPENCYKLNLPDEKEAGLAGAPNTGEFGSTAELVTTKPTAVEEPAITSDTPKSTSPVIADDQNV